MTGATTTSVHDAHAAPSRREGAGEPPAHRTSPAVRERMAEFLGQTEAGSVTAMYVAARTGEDDSAVPPPLPCQRMDRILEGGYEVARSLWDRQRLVVDLDIEYVNFDFPGEPYLNPERSFALQRPVVRAVRHLLEGWGIEPLHILSGRGHHFIWAVDRSSPAFRKLTALGRLPPSLAGRYRVPLPPGGVEVGERAGRAFAGLGLVMEYLAHRIRDMAAPESSIPVELGELEPQRATRGREMVAVDISEYGDPLSSRSVTIPFSRYLKPYRNRHAVGGHILHSLPPIFTLPHPRTAEPEAIRLMRREEEVVEMAERATAHIPEARANGRHQRHPTSLEAPEEATGMTALVETYLRSPLARYHEHFYSAEHDPPEIWHRTYDRTPLHQLAAPAREALARPNDLLLKPRAILEVVRELMGQGWHPRHIAGLIRSRYERPHGWGDRWYRDDAAARADHYARVFSGMFTLGRGPEP